MTTTTMTTTTTMMMVSDGGDGDGDLDGDGDGDGDGDDDDDDDEDGDGDEDTAIAKIHATWQRDRWIGLAGSARRQATSCPRATRTRSCPLWPEWSLCCRRACLLRLHRCKSTLPYAPLNSIERRHHL